MRARAMTLLLLTLLLWAPVNVRRASAQHGGKKEPAVFSSGMVGVVPGQSLRINTVHAGYPTDPCVRVALVIYDARGEIVAETKEAVELCPGKSAFLDHSPDFTDGKRLLLRGVVRYLEDDSYPTDPCAHTLEVFYNDTGRVAVVLASFVKVSARGRTSN